MKRKILFLLLAVSLCVSLAIPGAAGGLIGNYVIDEAGLLSRNEFENLEREAQKTSEEWGCGIYLAAVEDYHLYGSTPEKAAVAIYEANGWGMSQDHDGFMLLLSMAERDFWLMCHGTAGNYALSAEGRERLQDEFLPYFADNDWYGGFSAYVSSSEEFLEAAAAGEPLGEKGTSLLLICGISAGVSAVVALIVCMVFKSQMNTAVQQVDADDYVTRDGVTITDRTERYTHTTTSRTKIERTNASSGSSGSSGGSSGGYSGGGGKF